MGRRSCCQQGTHPCRECMVRLENQALLVALASAASREESSASSVLEHLTNALVGLGRALEVLVGANLLTNLLTLFKQVSHLRHWYMPPGHADSRRQGSVVLVGAGKLTSSGDTGFWLVLRSSSMVFWSYRRSFLQPTRMMGRPWQKCRTSEIHYHRARRQHWDTDWARPQGHIRKSLHTFSWTLSRESGESIAKQIRMTWESG
jgi:hypothetical protein